jgi:hypothetical protein
MKFLASLLVVIAIFTYAAQTCLIFYATWDPVYNSLEGHIIDNDQEVCNIKADGGPWEDQYTLLWACLPNTAHAAWITGDLRTLAYHAHGDDFRITPTVLNNEQDDRWVFRYYANLYGCTCSGFACWKKPSKI